MAVVAVLLTGLASGCGGEERLSKAQLSARLGEALQPS
jgi:hypothetical protein